MYEPVQSGEFQLSVTFTFDAPTVRSKIQYSQELTVAIPAAYVEEPPNACAALKYSALNACVLLPGAEIEMGLKIPASPVGNEKAAFPIFKTGPSM